MTIKEKHRLKLRIDAANKKYGWDIYYWEDLGCIGLSSKVSNEEQFKVLFPKDKQQNLFE